jgi:hypothetical protein
VLLWAKRGSRPPIDREARLATHLDRQSAPNPETQLCACGCGQPIAAESRHERGGTSTRPTASEHSAGKSDSRVSLFDNSEVTF